VRLTVEESGTATCDGRFRKSRSETESAHRHVMPLSEALPSTYRMSNMRKCMIWRNRWATGFGVVGVMRSAPVVDVFRNVTFTTAPG
jgi:hypothetical protein